MRITCVKARGGAYPWFGVPEGTINPSSPDAVWLKGGATLIQYQEGQ